MFPINARLHNDFDIKWFLLKLSFLFIWGSIIHIMIASCIDCPIPSGICKLYTFSTLFTPTGKTTLYLTITLLGIMYLLELNMTGVTLSLFCLSCIVITYHESNGIFMRATVLSAIWAAQFIAYAQRLLNARFDLNYYRKQYSIQIIAAVYTLAGIAKIKDSGIEWINSGENFSLQIIKNYSFAYFNTGDETFITKANYIVAILESNIWLLQLMLSLSLILELFCLFVVLNNRIKFYWGIGLFVMHIGIAWFLGIGISVIAFPMVIFFINPLFLILSNFQKYVLKRLV